MRAIVIVTLFFLMCSDCFSQVFIQRKDTLYVGKENITRIQIEKKNTLRDIKFTLDSNFVKLYENENIAEKYLYIKFDFYPKKFFLKNCLESLLLPKMEAVIIENKLDFNNSIYIRIGHCLKNYNIITRKFNKHKTCKTYKNVASFKRSIRKSFSVDMIIEEF